MLYHLRNNDDGAIAIETNATLDALMSFLLPGTRIAVPEVIVPSDEPPPFLKKKPDKKPSTPLSEQDKARVLMDLRTHPSTSAAQIADRTKVPVETVSKALRALDNAGEATCTGRGKGARWSAVEKAAGTGSAV